MNNKQLLIAKQLNRALQLFAKHSALSENEALEIADLYPAWEAAKAYVMGEIVKHGENEGGETQLWQVLQDHVSQGDWQPQSAPSLYKRCGFADDGVPLWVQPLGQTDAYMAGDVVEHNGARWQSAADYNIWEPGVYGWDAI